jgi:hypothetical protein
VNPVGTSVCDPTPCPDGTIRSTPISVIVPAGAAPPPLGDWTYSLPGCFPPDTDAAAPILTDAVIAESFRGLVTPSVPFVQPATGEALVNLPVVAYAEAGVDSWTPTLLGIPVAIRAVPVSYSWDFGDGSAPVFTDEPGAPYPNHTIEHTYTATGRAEISVTTTYTGEYSLDGGGTWVAIPGTATAPSPAITVTVVEARAQLTG